VGTKWEAFFSDVATQKRETGEALNNPVSCRGQEAEESKKRDRKENSRRMKDDAFQHT
jgi:hypothetical protein